MNIIQSIKKNQNNIKRDIYINKIFLKIIDDVDNSDKLAFVESINNSLDKRMQKYLETLEPSDYNLLENDYNTIVSLLDELKEDVVNKQKLVSAIMLENMKGTEIESFYKIFVDIYSKYKNIQQASSDIFYHSGMELSSFISKLVKYIKSHEVNNLKFIPLSFLEEHTAIITLDFKSWIILLKNLKITMKYLNDMNDVTIESLRKEFEKINVYYFIVITGGDA